MLDVSILLGTGASLAIAVSIWYFLPERDLYTLPKDVKVPSLLVSSTFHSRFKPILHSFRYPVLYICIDLDSIGYVDRIYSSRSKVWRPLSLKSEDYLGMRYDGSIKQKLWSHMADHGIDTKPLRRALLITTPRLLGYSFNPVSFHYVYDTDDRLGVVVLEVNNTFGEKHVYVLRQDDAQDKVRTGYDSAQTFPRRFHVSPFNDRSGSYQLQCRDPGMGQQLKVDMHLTLLEPDGTKKLTAQVNSNTPPILTTHTLACLWALLRHGAAVFLTVPRILFQAYKLHYGKKLAVYLRPEPYEDVGAIGRQGATPSALYLMDLLLEYLRAKSDLLPCTRITFDILPASQENRRVVIGGGKGGGGEELHVTVLSYLFFSSLATSESALTCLWTDSLAMSSPLFRVSDETLFLKVLSVGSDDGDRRLQGRFHLQSYRVLYRGKPAWFNEEALRCVPSGGEHVKYLHTTNNGLDQFVHEAVEGSRQSLWRYRYHVLSTLILGWIGNAAFGAIATFAGDAGRPEDEWLRVKMTLDQRRNDSIK